MVTIEQLPDFIIEQMLTNQEAQGNLRDINVFKKKIDAFKEQGGFNWSETPQGKKYWAVVFNTGRFPAQELTIGELIIVSYSDGTEGYKRYLGQSVINGTSMVIATTDRGYADWQSNNSYAKSVTLHSNWRKR